MNRQPQSEIANKRWETWVIKTIGDRYSEQIDIPREYIDKASVKYASKIIKEQINLDDISLKTIKELSNDDFSKQDNQVKEIDEDWINEFENNARQISSEGMRFVFSKILANEVKNPGNFSKRTIRLISQLDNIAAQLFQKLCSCAIALQDGNHTIDTRVVSLSGNAASNSLIKYGLSFDNLNILQEYGLVIADYNAYRNYKFCVVNEQNQFSYAFKFANGYFAFLPTDREKLEKEINLHGVVFTQAGKELYNIIPKEENIEYKTDFDAYLETRFLKLIQVKIA